MKTNLTLVVAGACNLRAQSLGPKPLWPVSDHERVFDWQLRLLNCEATERPVVVGGFQYDRLRHELGHLATVVHNHEWEKLGCGCSVQVGLHHAPPGRVVVTHGDVVYSPIEIPPSGSWVVATEPADTTPGEVGVVAGEWVSHLDYGVRPRWGQLLLLDAAERQILEDLPLRQEMLHEAVNRVIDEGGRFGLYQPSGFRMLDLDRPSDLARAAEFRRRYP